MSHPTSVFIRLSKVPGLDRAGLLSEMAQVSIQSAGWLPACLVRARITPTMVRSVTLLTQVVNLCWEEGGEQHKQELLWTSAGRQRQTEMGGCERGLRC